MINFKNFFHSPRALQTDLTNIEKLSYNSGYHLGMSDGVGAGAMVGFGFPAVVHGLVTLPEAHSAAQSLWLRLGSAASRQIVSGGMVAHAGVQPGLIPDIIGFPVLEGPFISGITAGTTPVVGTLPVVGALPVAEPITLGLIAPLIYAPCAIAGGIALMSVGLWQFSHGMVVGY